MAEEREKKNAKRRKTGSSRKDTSGPVISDPRFANIQSDPRFRLPSKRHTHVKLDKRFAHMLRDDDFSRNAAVDRYGRKLRKDDTKKQLERFYRLDEDEEGERGERESSGDDDEDIEKELRRVEKSDYDPARHGGFSASESSSDEESEEEMEDDDDDAAVELEFPDKGKDDVPMGEVTGRIAVVNLDWDHIRAEDLMAVFSSFLPLGDRILKVSIYPSEFGRERMEREDMEGPPKELFAKKSKDEEENVSMGEDEDEEQNIRQAMLKEDDAGEFNSTQLRKYQIERLRYFYAVLTFSSSEAAKKVYDAIDGAEYMSSANFLDLRFVPDDTDFEEETPRDECERIPDGYKPSHFVTDALQHSKVKLTWDADDTSRKEAQARAFKGSRKEIDENDLKAYLGSDSSEDDDDGDGEGGDNDQSATRGSKLSKKEAQRAKMRSLLGLGDKPTSKAKDTAPVGDMEVTFSAGLSAAPARESVFENEPEKEETTREKYIRKERERKQRRKAKHKNKTQDESMPAGEGNTDDNNAKEQQDQDLGFDDPFFAAPEKDVTAGGKKSKQQKKDIREQREADEAASAAKRAELELLMVDDKASGINHFDMNEIEKAEKRAKKKHKKGKKGASEPEPDNFKMDVQDPRFQRLYESHDFAIDPTNPRFKNTQGMNALLAEGRKRRRRKENEEADGEAATPSKKKKKSVADKPTQGEDLNKLLQRVKGKTKRKE